MFVVAKGTWEIHTRHVVEKARPSLADEQIVEIARLAVELETKMGFPVDIECAYQDGDLYLLQCRTITALQQGSKAVESSGFDTVHLAWDRPDEAELTWSKSKENVLPLQQSLSLYYYQGWAKAFREGKVVGGLRARYVCGCEYRCWQWNPTLSWPETEALQQELEQQVPARWRDQWLPTIQSDLKKWDAVDLTTLADDALAAFLHDMLNRQIHHWEIHAIMGSVPLSAVQRLIDWYLARFPNAPESEPYKLVQGQSNLSVQMNHNLWRLSCLVSPDVAAALHAERWIQLPNPFRTEFESHLEQFGLKLPDKQRQTARLLLHYAENETKDPYPELEGLAAERDAFTVQVRTNLNPDEVETFERLRGCALGNNPLTEDHNYWLDQRSDAATRRVIAEFVRRLVEYEILEHAEDVEYLSVFELIQWGFALANPLRPLIDARKTEFEMYRRVKTPDFLGKPPQPTEWVDRFSGPSVPLASPPGTLHGVGASAGLARGPARIARTLDDALAAKAGEILVCPYTDPTWTPLFGIVAGLVTETGGSLSHAAVVAREYRLPAVVGTHFATTQIHPGQIVAVDGARGIVYLE
jgi:pyruvate,water dikinase